MYLDPGFGSMLIQVLIASLAAGGAMLAVFRGKIKSKFKGKKNGDSSSSAQDGKGDENDDQ